MALCDECEHDPNKHLRNGEYSGESRRLDSMFCKFCSSLYCEQFRNPLMKMDRMKVS